MGIKFAVRRTGPLTMAASEVAIFARTRPELETPDVQFHIQPRSADSPGEGLHRFSAFTASPACALSTLRSCRPWSPATLTRLPS